MVAQRSADLGFTVRTAVGGNGVIADLDSGKPARSATLPEVVDAKLIVRDMQLLTTKPTFYVANVDEASLANLGNNPHYAALLKYANAENAPVVDKAIRDLDIPRDATIVAVVRGEHVVMPRGDTVFESGDEVLAMVTSDSEDDVRQILTGG